MNDVVSARNACGFLCLRNRSFLHLLCGAGGLTCSIACSGRTRTFSSPQPAFCQNPFNVAVTRRLREARLCAALGLLATLPERGGRYPGLICARGRGAFLAGGRPSHPLIAAILLIAVRRRPSGDAADGKSRLLLMPLPPPPPPFHFDVYKLPGSSHPAAAVFEYQRQLANGWQGNVDD